MEFLIFILAIFVVLGFLIRANVKNSKRMKQKMSELGALDVFPAFHVEGLGLEKNAMCELYLFNDRILIENGTKKFEVKHENIRAAVVKNEQELIEKGKSVVGRAVIGTLLVPGLGTIVGGMSGIGTKKKKGKTNSFLILNYINSKGEMAAVTFLNNINFIKIDKFCKNINELSNQLKPEVVQL